MALTNAQLNSHLRAIVVQHFTGNEEGLTRFLETCRDYAVVGGANEKEASRTIAREVFSRVVGRALTADDVHLLTNHKVNGGGAVL